MNILVINGPNLNLLGTREPEVYGTETLEEIMTWLESTPEAVRHTFKFFQSNHEGEIIDTLHENMKWADG
ncbi:MAG: type II 3-dehydroquinate dehydratase, partial [Candidatus Marinimicrobia bacterium]|nr:type II 3-dehydroquinate dehydratase [Candidatus Neomarinimicrobiota bacterium]